MKVTVTVSDPEKLASDRGLLPGGKVQKFIDSEVIRCADPYVPMQTGMLKRSATMHTVIGSGKVQYVTPYAKRQYYENSGFGKQGTANGGRRGRLWIQRMKAARGQAILNGAARLAGGKGIWSGQ